MTPVSVVILTRNEENRIADCLKSVDWAEERLIIDDGSTDKTVEIASGLGARVLHHRMEIEGRHRNWAHAQVRTGWVLSLDADERVTPELAQEIQDLIAGTPSCDIYSIPRRNYIGKRWIQNGGWYPSPQVKLFRPAVFQWEETTVHPRAISQSDKPWGQLHHDIIHFSYRDIADFAAKTNRHTTQEATKWVQDGRKMSLGKAFWRTGDRFYRTFWSKKGYRDGFLGYLVALFAGLYQLLSYAKYWHLKQTAGKEIGFGPRSGMAASAPSGGRAGMVSPASLHSGDEHGRTPERGIPRWGMPSGAGAADWSGGQTNDSPAPEGPGKARLSAVILAKNAAHQIDACLNSIRWADEIIVVDGGSTDETVALCQKAGAKVLVDTTVDDFGHLRNAGTEAASGEWILQLDADEQVTVEFWTALEKILEQPPQEAAFKFRRQNVFLGRLMRFGGWDHDSLHLFQRGRARYKGRIHEKLVVSGPIGRLRAGVLHEPFRSMEEFMDRQNRYTTLEARQLWESRGRLPRQEIHRQAVLKPIKLFWKMYLKKQGFREGMHGFLFSLLFAFVHFLKWAKYWEILDAQESKS